MDITKSIAEFVASRIVSNWPRPGIGQVWISPIDGHEYIFTEDGQTFNLVTRQNVDPYLYWLEAPSLGWRYVRDDPDSDPYSIRG